jgi:arginine N-succinyltransferase
VNDFDGASEVGGLFLHPQARSGGFGALLARSRYMFIARHRERFSDRVVAELRGWTEHGISPFWEAVGKPFFGSDFYEADRHNALHGNQFIADLMPRYPIYATMLPRSACEAIGRPHEGSVPAKKMLESEGFAFDSYVDIFDAGPTLSVSTDQIRTIRECRPLEGSEPGLISRDTRALLATGTGLDFSVRYAP